MLNFIPVFSQNSGFSSLDPLGPEYGKINQQRLDPISMEPFEGDRQMRMPEINFPKSTQPSTQSVRSSNYESNNVKRNVATTYETITDVNGKNPEESEAVQKINKQFDEIVQGNQSQDSYSKLSSYNTEELNYDRFKNSPCFEKIGFNPSWDMTALENEYSDCEHEQQGKTVSNIIFVIMFLILIAVVIFFSLSKEKRTQLISKIIKT
jgi:hypothetical protein